MWFDINANGGVCSCERENQWLDEAPYYIDTSLVPRGGARRRKSMEPKALANMNGMLVSTPARSVSNPIGNRECYTAPRTPKNRRESSLWMRTPEDEGTADIDADGEPVDEDASEWEAGFLMPVPKTPAPEVIARYAANVAPETPSGASEYSEDPLNDPKAELMTRTCPPKQPTYYEMGVGILQAQKDEGVLMRLMAARRKSLQFAPKVGSPLARTWN